MDNLSTKRILITGGLGYIGSEIFNMVEENSRECLAIDKLADPVRSTVRASSVRGKGVSGGIQGMRASNGASALKGPLGRAVSNGAYASGHVQSLDLKDAAKTSKIIIDFKPDVIIHCATHSALAYRDHFANSFAEDFSATINILNALTGRPDCRLIYLSSSYVYSGLPAHQNYDEDSLLAPQHNFGIAKSFFEQFILKIHPNTVIFRLSSVFGPGQALHPNVILTFAEECLKNNSLTVWGKGERKLQYIYIKDVANIILRSFSAHAKGGDGSVPLAEGEMGGDLAPGIYNLGGDDYISVRDTATDIANFFSVKVNFLENKPEGETLPFLSNQKIKDAWGNDILTPFSSALAEYLISLNKT